MRTVYTNEPTYWLEKNNLTVMYGHVLHTSNSIIIINPVGTLATLSLMHPRVEPQNSGASSTEQLGTNIHKDDIVEIVDMGVWETSSKCIYNSVLKQIPYPFETEMYPRRQKEPLEVHKVQNSFRLRKQMKI